MSNYDELPVFVLFANGVPSRRHLVVARRADVHLRELFGLFVEASLEEGGLTGCHVDSINSKMEILDKAVEELEERTSDAARADVAETLQSVKKRFKELRDMLKLQAGCCEFLLALTLYCTLLTLI